MQNERILSEIRKDGGEGFIASAFGGPFSIFLIKCPECKKDNHTVRVSSGICCHCGFNANTNNLLYLKNLFEKIMNIADVAEIIDEDFAHEIQARIEIINEQLSKEG